MPEKTYIVGKDKYQIPDEKTKDFLSVFPDAEEAKTFTVGKDTFELPQSKITDFLTVYPDAKQVGYSTSSTAPFWRTVTDTVKKGVSDFKSKAVGFKSELGKTNKEGFVTTPRQGKITDFGLPTFDTGIDLSDQGLERAVQTIDEASAEFPQPIKLPSLADYPEGTIGEPDKILEDPFEKQQKKNEEKEITGAINAKFQTGIAVLPKEKRDELKTELEQSDMRDDVKKGLTRALDMSVTPYINPDDMRKALDLPGSTQSGSVVQDLYTGVSKLQRQSLEGMVSNLPYELITKGNIDRIIDDFDNTYLGTDVQIEDKRELMRRWWGYDQDLSGYFFQGIPQAMSMIVEAGLTRKFVGNFGAQEIEGLTQANGILYKGLRSLAGSSRDAYSFGLSQALFRGATSQNEMRDNMVMSYSFHYGNAAWNNVFNKMLGDWMLSNPGVTTKMVNAFFKTAGGTVVGSGVGTGLSGDISEKTFIRELPMMAVFSVMGNGSKFRTRDYALEMTDIAVKKGLPESARNVYSNLMVKSISDPKVRQFIKESYDFTKKNKVNIKDLAESPIDPNAEFPAKDIAQIMAEINVPIKISEKAQKQSEDILTKKKEPVDGKEKEVQEEKILGDVTDVNKSGQGTAGVSESAQTTILKEGEQDVTARINELKKSGGEAPDLKRSTELARRSIEAINEKERRGEDATSDRTELAQVLADHIVKNVPSMEQGVFAGLAELVKNIGNFESKTFVDVMAKQIKAIEDLQSEVKNSDLSDVEKLNLDSYLIQIKTRPVQIMGDFMGLKDVLNSKDWQKTYDEYRREKKETQPQEFPVSIKNAYTDAELERLGMPAFEKTIPRERQTAMDEAKARMTADPDALAKLKSKIEEDETYAPTDVENMMFTREFVASKLEMAKLGKEVQETGSQEAYDALRFKAAEIAKNIEIYKKAGTASSHSLSSRKAMVNMDYSLAKMTSDKILAKGGQLSKEEIDNVTKLSKEIDELKLKIDAAEKERDEVKREFAFSKQMEQFKKEAEKKVKGVNREERIKEIRKRRDEILKEVVKTYSANVGVNYDLRPLAKLIETHIEEISLRGKWKIEDVYESVRNELKGLGLRVPDEDLQKAYQQHLQSTSDKPKQFSVYQINKLARNLVESGVTDAKDLVQQAYEILSKIDPKITEREVQDMISGYGDFKPLSKDQISVELRDYKGQLQQMSKIEDMKSGIAPVKTGIERRTPSDIERQLIKEVNELKKIGGYRVIDADKQLKSAMDAIMTRYKNMIADLKYERESGKRIVKTRTKLELDEKAKAVRDEYLSLRKEVDAFFGFDGLLNRRKNYVKGQIEKYDKIIADVKSGILPEKKEPKNYKKDAELVNLEYEMAKKKAQADNDVFELLLKNRSVGKKGWDAFVNLVDLSRASVTSVDLSAPLRQGKFMLFSNPIVSAKAFPVMIRSFLSEKETHAANMRILHDEHYGRAIRAKLFLSEHGHNLTNFEEAVRTKWGDKIPVISWSNRAYTTYLNQVRYNAFKAGIKSMGRMGNKGQLSKQEDMVIANLINVASGRGSNMRIMGKDLNAALDAANLVFFAPRYVVSRFQLGLGQPMAKAIATEGFASRATLFTAKEYAKYVAGVATAMAISKAFMDDQGEDLEMDPRSSQFLKVKIGKRSWLDMYGGLQQTAVLLTRLATGEIKDKEKIRSLTGDVGAYKSNWGDVGVRFLRSKLAPIPRVIIDVASGKDYLGNDVEKLIKDMKIIGLGTNVYKEMKNRGMSKEAAYRVATGAYILKELATPMNINSIYEGMKAEGMSDGVIIGILSTFGESIQTYEKRK